MSSAFNKAVGNKSALFQSMREAKDKGFTVPEVDDGKYTFHVKARCDTTENGNAYVALDWEIMDEGPFQGAKSNLTYWLTGEDDERVQKSAESLALAFKKLLDMDELNIEDSSDIEQIVDIINNEDVYCTGNLRNWESKKDPTKKGIGIYFSQKVPTAVA